MPEVSKLKYKVGDKVKVISYQDESHWEKDYDIEVGDIVEIVSVNMNNYCVTSKTNIINVVVYITEDCLELVEEEVSKKFKVGDKVVRTGHTYADKRVITGEIYTIFKVCEKLNALFLEGVYNLEGELDWFNPNNFELVKEDFHLGDRVKVVSLQDDYYRGDCEVGIGATGVITDIDEDHVLKYCVEPDEGSSWWWEEENLELVKEEETMSEQTTTGQTPYQEKGYTKNSLFKFVGDDGEFEQGEILKLSKDDGDDTPRFKSSISGWEYYLDLEDDVEYIGEEGSEDMLPNYEEVLTTQPTNEVVTQDNVNSPSHYSSSKIECIVAMEAMLSYEEFIGYLRGNIFKYQWRYKQKNGIEDLKKAQWYQNKLLEKEQDKEGVE